MGDVIKNVPFGAGRDSDGSRTDEELHSMSKHPTAFVQNDRPLSSTPEGGNYLAEIFEDPSGKIAAKRGKLGATIYRILNSLDDLMYPGWLFPEKQTDPVSMRRRRVVGVFLSLALSGTLCGVSQLDLSGANAEMERQTECFQNNTAYRASFEQESRVDNNGC